jgi:probable HAF family extracellular repeat protein
MKRVLFAGLLCVVLGVTGLVGAEDGSITNIDVPGASGTFPLGINDYGEVAGYCELKGIIHGFTHKNGRFTTLDIPPLPNTAGRVYTIITGINNHGDVGYYVREQEGVHKSFIYSRGVFASIEFPGAKDTVANGINDFGDVVGIINQGSFLYSEGTFSLLPTPRVDIGSVEAIGINNKGQIVGYYLDFDDYHAFIYQDGEFTMLPLPANIPWGINDHGDVMLSKAFSTSAFFYSKGRLNAVQTPRFPVGLGGINNAGKVVGVYRSPEGEHAYMGHLKRGNDD